MRDILAGSTDVTIYMHLRQLADPTLDATVVSGPFTLQYVRTRATAVTASSVDLGSANAAHSDNGAFHVGNGIWRFDFPDAAFAASLPEVVLTVVHPDVLTESLAVPLVAYNPLDSVRLGLTALPNAAAEAAGGLYTRGAGAGQINQDSNGRIDTRSVALDADVITATSIQANAFTTAKFADGFMTAAKFAANAITSTVIADGALTAAKAAAGFFDAVWTVTTRLLSAGTNIVLAKGVGVTGFNDLSSSQVESASAVGAAAALTAYDGPTNAEMEARTLTAASYATASALTTVGNNVSAVKAKTDPLTYTVDNQVDVNVRSNNSTLITGTGQSGDKWRPAA